MVPFKMAVKPVLEHHLIFIAKLRLNERGESVCACSILVDAAAGCDFDNLCHFVLQFQYPNISACVTIGQALPQLFQLTFVPP